MCIKIISPQAEQEFDMSRPLENQIENANKIVVSYDPEDPKIDSFVGQIELMVKNGIGCSADIKVNCNNHINGFKLERQLGKLKKKLEVNEVVKGLCRLHAEADSKLSELSKMCLEKIDERQNT